MNGNPTLATSAMRTNPSLFSTFLIISFSIGLVRFRQPHHDYSRLFLLPPRLTNPRGAA
jgi:hypothetical protein